MHCVCFHKAPHIVEKVQACLACTSVCTYVLYELPTHTLAVEHLAQSMEKEQRGLAAADPRPPARNVAHGRLVLVYLLTTIMHFP
jgi:hypothetical protein